LRDLVDADEYNSTEYLSHLNQQMVVLVNCNEKFEDHDRSTTDRNQQKVEVVPGHTEIESITLSLHTLNLCSDKTHKHWSQNYGTKTNSLEEQR